MNRTKPSTKPCLDEQRAGESAGWDDSGLVEAALEGRLGRQDGVYRARGRPLELGTSPAASAAGGGVAPLHVPDAEGQVPRVRLVEASGPEDGLSPALRTRMIRAIGFLAVILAALLLADVLQP